MSVICIFMYMLTYIYITYIHTCTCMDKYIHMYEVLDLPSVIIVISIFFLSQHLYYLTEKIATRWDLNSCLSQYQ